MCSENQRVTSLLIPNDECSRSQRCVKPSSLNLFVSNIAHLFRLRVCNTNKQTTSRRLLLLQIFNSVYPLTRSFFGGSVFLGSAAAWVTLVSPLVAAAVHLGNRGDDSDGGGGAGNRRDIEDFEQGGQVDETQISPTWSQYIGQKHTLLHKLRKKTLKFGLLVHFLTNFIAERSKISPKFPIWAMKSPTWPPWFWTRIFNSPRGFFIFIFRSFFLRGTEFTLDMFLIFVSFFVFFPHLIARIPPPWKLRNIEILKRTETIQPSKIRTLKIKELFFLKKSCWFIFFQGGPFGVDFGTEDRR